MRVLVAHDLSPASEVAVGQVLHATWPAGTVVRVISSPVGIGPELSSFANVREARAHARIVESLIEQTHARVSADLADAGVTVERDVVAGNPDDAIVEAAEGFAADVVVVGARTQGSMAATVLGSVSRAVVERAACSVLVARCTTARRVLLATDGSGPARRATTIIGTWPMFTHSRVVLLAVGRPAPRYAGLVLDEGERVAAYADTIDASAHEAQAILDYALAELRTDTRDVRAEVRIGDVADELVAAAAAWPADIVVVGTEPPSLLERLVLGSVARRVVDGVSCSVLVARPARPEHPDQPPAG